MIRQIKYFHSVVRNDNFSLAAEECNISQSAISQQIKALEEELGFLLFERKNRKCFLTPAGEQFYKKSLILIADYERICSECKKIAHGDEFKLRIGYLRCYSGEEFQRAVEIKHGNHEELYKMLKAEEVDIVLNDQRRALSDEYVNKEFITTNISIVLAKNNPISNLEEVEISELKNIPCILVSSPSQQKIEEEFYKDVVGIQSEFLFAESLEEAKLLVISGKGFMILEGAGESNSSTQSSTSVKRLTLLNNKHPISRKYCAFWKNDNSGFFVEEFADLLEKEFKQ